MKILAPIVGHVGTTLPVDQNLLRFEGTAPSHAHQRVSYILLASRNRLIQLQIRYYLSYIEADTPSLLHWRDLLVAFMLGRLIRAAQCKDKRNTVLTKQAKRYWAQNDGSGLWLEPEGNDWPATFGGPLGSLAFELFEAAVEGDPIELAEFIIAKVWQDYDLTQPPAERLEALLANLGVLDEPWAEFENSLKKLLTDDLDLIPESLLPLAQRLRLDGLDEAEFSNLPLRARLGEWTQELLDVLHDCQVVVNEDPVAAVYLNWPAGPDPERFFEYDQSYTQLMPPSGMPAVLEAIVVESLLSLVKQLTDYHGLYPAASIQDALAQLPAGQTDALVDPLATIIDSYSTLAVFDTFLEAGDLAERFRQSLNALLFYSEINEIPFQGSSRLTVFAQQLAAAAPGLKPLSYDGSVFTTPTRTTALPPPKEYAKVQGYRDRILRAPGHVPLLIPAGTETPENLREILRQQPLLSPTGPNKPTVYVGRPSPPLPQATPTRPGGTINLSGDGVPMPESQAPQQIGISFSLSPAVVKVSQTLSIKVTVVGAPPVLPLRLELAETQGSITLSPLNSGPVFGTFANGTYTRELRVEAAEFGAWGLLRVTFMINGRTYVASKRFSILSESVTAAPDWEPDTPSGVENDENLLPPTGPNPATPVEDAPDPGSDSDPDAFPNPGERPDLGFQGSNGNSLYRALSYITPDTISPTGELPWLSRQSAQGQAENDLRRIQGDWVDQTFQIHSHLSEHDNSEVKAQVAVTLPLIQPGFEDYAVELEYLGKLVATGTATFLPAVDAAHGQDFDRVSTSQQINCQFWKVTTGSHFDVDSPFINLVAQLGTINSKGFHVLSDVWQGNYIHKVERAQDLMSTMASVSQHYAIEHAYQIAANAHTISGDQQFYADHAWFQIGQQYPNREILPFEEEPRPPGREDADPAVLHPWRTQLSGGWGSMVTYLANDWLIQSAEGNMVVDVAKAVVIRNRFEPITIFASGQEEYNEEFIGSTQNQSGGGEEEPPEDDGSYEPEVGSGSSPGGSPTPGDDGSYEPDVSNPAVVPHPSNPNLVVNSETGEILSSGSPNPPSPPPSSNPNSNLSAGTRPTLDQVFEVGNGGGGMFRTEVPAGAIAGEGTVTLRGPDGQVHTLRDTLAPGLFSHTSELPAGPYTAVIQRPGYEPYNLQFTKQDDIGFYNPTTGASGNGLPLRPDSNYRSPTERTQIVDAVAQAATAKLITDLTSVLSQPASAGRSAAAADGRVLSDIGNAVLGSLQQAGTQVINDVANTVVTEANSAISQATGGFLNDVNGLVNFVRDPTRPLLNAGNQILGQATGGLLNDIEGLLSNPGATLGGALANLGNQALSQVMSQVNSLVSGVTSQITSSISGAISNLIPGGIGSSIGGALSNAIGSTVNGFVGNLINGTLGNVGNLLNNALGSVTQALTGQVQNLLGSIIPGFSAGAYMDGLNAAIAGSLGSAFAGITGDLSALGGGLAALGGLGALAADDDGKFILNLGGKDSVVIHGQDKNVSIRSGQNTRIHAQRNLNTFAQVTAQHTALVNQEIGAGAQLKLSSVGRSTFFVGASYNQLTAGIAKRSAGTMHMRSAGLFAIDGTPVMINCGLAIPATATPVRAQKQGGTVSASPLELQSRQYKQMSDVKPLNEEELAAPRPQNQASPQSPEPSSIYADHPDAGKHVNLVGGSPDMRDSVSTDTELADRPGQ